MYLYLYKNKNYRNFFIYHKEIGETITNLVIEVTINMFMKNDNQYITTIIPSYQEAHYM